MVGLRREDAAPLVAALPALALFTWWAADGGEYFPATWMPGALLLLWLLALVVVLPGAGGPRRPARAAIVALAALALYTAWSFLSITWARSEGVAYEGSMRTLLYLAGFATFVLTPWTARAARVALLAFVAAVTVVAIVTLARASAGPEAIDLFNNGRLAAPLGYQNASAALWMMAALPALALGASGATPALARPPLLAACGLLLGMAVLTQSRGWLFTLPVVALVALALLRGADRGRFVAFAVPVAVALAPALPRLLDPYDVGGGGRDPSLVAPAVHDAMTSAAPALALVALALLVVGALLVWLDGRVSERMPRRTGDAVVVVTLVAGLAAGLVATHGNPIGRAGDAWSEFKDFEAETNPRGTNRFFGDLASGRYDLWRVAVDRWEERPLGGLGQDNFATAYVRDRATPHAAPRWIHSFPLRALVHTGIVGAALLLAFFGAVAFGALRAPPSARQIAAIALLPAADWLVHGSADWFWEHPALTAPALAFAGLALALGQKSHTSASPELVRRRTAPRAAAIVLAVAGTIAVVPPYLAELHVNRALRGWPQNPALALARLDRAQSLNPLDAHSAVVEGVIAVQVGDLDRARKAFIQAVERDPDAWFAPLQLGLIAGEQGDRAAAQRRLREARARNPRSPVVAEALRRAAGRIPLTLRDANLLLARESAEQQGRRFGGR